MVNAPDLSLRGPNGAVAISGRHFQFVQSADKTYKPIASVAAFPAQPLAALPPYGCGVPLADCERPAGWQYLRHKFIGAMPSSLSLRGGRRPTWQSRSTRPDHRKAIGENAAAFPRLPRRFAPRNDTSGSAVVYQRPPTVELPCTGRSLRSRWRLCRLMDAACPLRVMSALQGGNTYGTNSLAQCHQVCHCEEAAGRRGNLAVPDQITGKPSAKTQLPSRDCTPRALPRASRSGRHGPFGASQ